ncbi:MAG: purine-nucleoside phosphorylase [Flavobacteriales bacterium]|jgi:purine-nucleoside phosphorylase|nr:purine-nucleoside phosphorylase [Flavobacteriales bacterium]
MNLIEIKETVDFLNSRGVYKAENAIILGTGLGKLADLVTDGIVIPYSEIPHFPLSTVESHSGNLILGKLENINVIIFQGRFHFYEGYSMDEIVFPVRVLKFLEVKNLFISNASGAINLSFKKGQLMLIKDHINLFPTHPLRGSNSNELGVRFPDMSNAYDGALNELVLSSAKKLNIQLNQGVYISAQGPMLETPAEYRMLVKLGGDVVGMSTIPEVIAARHIGIKCCAISVLTDECDPDNLEPINIEEIIRIAGMAEKKLIDLLLTTLRSLKNV